MAYDVVRSVAVLFGGNGADLGSSFGDTWEWDGNLWKRVQDIGPSPATGAALVFRTAVSALFGGISAIDNVQGRKLFGLTWEWDGHHWTARQDIGVGARFRHAMAYDSVRARVVLFGGLSVPPDEQDADSKLKGDTWEHADASPPPPPNGQEVSVASISVQPPISTAGSVLTIEVVLAAPAPPQGQTIEITSDAPFLNGQITIPAGAQSFIGQVAVPPDVGNTVPLPFQAVVTAAASDGSQVTTNLMIQ